MYGVMEKETTMKDQMTLTWGENTKTVMLDKETNVGNISTAEGFKTYTTMINKQLKLDNNLTYQEKELRMIIFKNEIDKTFNWEKGKSNDEITKYSEAKINDKINKYLLYHENYGHISPRMLQAMVKNNTINIHKPPQDQIPKCTACLYGKACKKRRIDKPRK